jgi:hypothetical protein
LASAFLVQLLSPLRVPNDYSYWNESYGKTEEQFPEGLWKWSVSVGSVAGSYAIDRQPFFENLESKKSPQKDKVSPCLTSY